MCLALKGSRLWYSHGKWIRCNKSSSTACIMNSDFTALPKVVAEGRKQINNLRKSCRIILIKNSIFCNIAFVFSYIIITISNTTNSTSLVGSCAIGIPAFFLALLPKLKELNMVSLEEYLRLSIPNEVF